MKLTRRQHERFRICCIGFSLVEVLTSLLIGSLALAGALTLFGRQRAAWQSAENLAGLEERLAYAATAIESDLRQSGYWGSVLQPDEIQVPTDIGAFCGGNDVGNWAFRLNQSIMADDGISSLPCRPKANRVASADTLTLRFAYLPPTAARDNQISLIVQNETGKTFLSNTPATDASDTDQAYVVAVRAWYLDTASSEHGLPGLRRHTLMSGGQIQNQEIIPGIVDFQISLGVDRDGDDLIDGFIDPATTAADSTIKAVRFWLLARSPGPEPGHFDSKPWYSIDSDKPGPRYFNDKYRRASIERTIWLRNPARAYSADEN